MVTDQQVRRLRRLMQTENNQAIAASKSGMSEKTARKYLRQDKLPSQTRFERTYRTREDGFAEVWSEIEALLITDPRVESKTIFEHLCREYEGRFEEGQLRTLQRRVKRWRIRHGRAKEVMFPQQHQPGRQGQSDYTHMGELGVTIQKEPFDHLFYHFTLTYSNWETGLVCFSESFESLSQGLQNALWELGAVPQEHRTDSLSAAVNNLSDTTQWTARYSALMSHYGLRPSHNNPGRGHENGDVEQSHHRFKRAVEQAMILRGSRDFATRAQYEELLQTVLRRRNSARQSAFREEMAVMRELPPRRVEDYTREQSRVSRNSTVTVRHNLYSVDSRLIGEVVEVRVYAEQLEVWHGGQSVQNMPRLRGSGKHLVNYRHVIDSLVRKPGAFAAYRYRTDLFPSLIFRVAYDCLQQQRPQEADRQYVKLLYLAREHGQERVETILRGLIDQGQAVSEQSVRALVNDRTTGKSWEVGISAVELTAYDQLLGGGQEVRQWAQS
jgi:hypothetical protein